MTGNDMIEWIQQYWLTVLFGGMTGLLTCVLKKVYSSLLKKYTDIIADIENEKKEQISIKDGVLALLYDRLYQACQYYIQRGYITVEELST